MFIIVTNLGLLFGCGVQVGSNGGIFIGHPEDSFNISVQLPPSGQHIHQNCLPHFPTPINYFQVSSVLPINHTHLQVSYVLHAYSLLLLFPDLRASISLLP